MPLEPHLQAPEFNSVWVFEATLKVKVPLNVSYLRARLTPRACCKLAFMTILMQVADKSHLVCDIFKCPLKGMNFQTNMQILGFFSNCAHKVRGRSWLLYQSDILLFLVTALPKWNAYCFWSRVCSVAVLELLVFISQVECTWNWSCLLRRSNQTSDQSPACFRFVWNHWGVR